MGKGWETAKAILGLHTCRMAYYPRPDEQPSNRTCHVSDVREAQQETVMLHPYSGSPSRSPSRMAACRSIASCAICLEMMKPGRGHALFTAECSHTFHFPCITANVRHGNFVCPVCRAKWKDVPWQNLPLIEAGESGRRSDSQSRRELRQPHRADVVPGSGFDSGIRSSDHSVLRFLHHASTNGQRLQYSAITPDPPIFDDDELLVPRNNIETLPDNEYPEGGSSNDQTREVKALYCSTEQLVGIQEQQQVKLDERIKLTAFAEVEAVACSETRDDFTVLVHLKAPAGRGSHDLRVGISEGMTSNPRAPIDLVTVLDVSGSMAGGKLRLLKRAMNFVISHLSSEDRLSIVVFSSTARRLLPLRRMLEDGKQAALRAIDGLISSGGTNIAQGLRKGAKVLEDRRVLNPVASIILLSDGQDMYDMSSPAQNQSFPHPRGRLNRHRLLPPSIRQYLRHGQASYPVHAFGFGADHDAITMHAIAEHSGGTFSFIQAEATVQDAFAQCIGGLLSVVVQEVEVILSSGTDTICLRKLEAGSYDASITERGDGGIVKFGDMYADEERDVLVQLKLPACEPCEHSEMPLLKVDCLLNDPISKRSVRISMPEISIRRPELQEPLPVSLEVDSQRNRLRIAQSIAQAGALADRGDIAGARQTLAKAKAEIQGSTAWQSGDHLSKALESELTEIQARMTNRQLYERSGRAYILSAHSSHFRQRATTRGHSMDHHSRDYQTPSMVDMVYRSQTHDFSHASSAPRAGDRRQPSSPTSRSSPKIINPSHHS